MDSPVRSIAIPVTKSLNSHAIKPRAKVRTLTAATGNLCAMPGNIFDFELHKLLMWEKE
jgi:hypothetical protein